MNGSEASSLPYRLLSALRRAAVQPAVDLAWVRLGVPFHRLAVPAYGVAAAILLARTALRAFLVGWRGTPDALTVGVVAVAFAAAFLFGLVRLAGASARFSKAAARDPFLAVDAYYRLAPTGDLAATYAALVACLGFPALLEAGRLAGLVARYGSPDDPITWAVAVLVLLDLAFPAATVLAVAVAACERSRKARRRREARTRTPALPASGRA